MAQPLEMSRQLDLFGTPAGRPHRVGRDAARVAPHPDPPAVLDLAAGLPSGLRLGTSSWSFPGWRGIVYAEDAAPGGLSRLGLGAYAAHPWLRTVGIDSTFYALPDAARLAGYAARVPADFRFLVKAPALLTDARARAEAGRPIGPNPHFLDSGLAVEQVVAPVLEGLGARVGVLLFQFPPLGTAITTAPRRFAENLYRFLRRLPVGPTYAVELRDPGLLTRDLVEALRHGGARPGYAIHPRLPGLDEQRTRFADLPPGPTVLRWVLRPNLGYAQAKARYRPFDRLREPDPVTRQRIAELLIAALAPGFEAFVIVNNKAEGSAPASLLALAKALLARDASPPRSAAPGPTDNKSTST